MKKSLFQTQVEKTHLEFIWKLRYVRKKELIIAHLQINIELGIDVYKKNHFKTRDFDPSNYKKMLPLYISQ